MSQTQEAVQVRFDHTTNGLRGVKVDSTEQSRGEPETFYP
jgi:hypothetical protein